MGTLRPGCPLGKAHQAAGSQEEGGDDACCKFRAVGPGVLSAGSLCLGCPLGSFLQALHLIFFPLWLRALFLFSHALLPNYIINAKTFPSLSVQRGLRIGKRASQA